MGECVSGRLLRCVELETVRAERRDPIDDETLRQAATIVDDVRRRRAAALIEYGEGLGDLDSGSPVSYARAELDAALASLPEEQRSRLDAAAGRIRTFAEAQRNSMQDVVVDIPGGQAGHTLRPVDSVGCYVPGGRYSLVSTVLMTAIPARCAGVESVWVASPRPSNLTLASAALCGVDGLLAVGGPQAIAALAYGVDPVPACDVVVGPGNRWVTAAKQHVSRHVRIDLLGGPSELLVLADATGNPAWIAADLLAQAEHDPDALPILVSLDATLVDAVESSLVQQLAELPDSGTAKAALSRGFAVVAPDLEAAVGLCDAIAPEHLAVVTRDARAVGARLRHYGALFVGGDTAQVLGDYGAGPNHVLPTGGSARFAAGLSVGTFLRAQSWVRVDDRQGAQELLGETATLARWEGLEAHARSAERRLGD